jgi:hypothetical protein
LTSAFPVPAIDTGHNTVKMQTLAKLMSKKSRAASHPVSPRVQGGGGGAAAAAAASPAADGFTSASPHQASADSGGAAGHTTMTFGAAAARPSAAAAAPHLAALSMLLPATRQPSASTAPASPSSQQPPASPSGGAGLPSRVKPLDLSDLQLSRPTASRAPSQAVTPRPTVTGRYGGSPSVATGLEGSPAIQLQLPLLQQPPLQQPQHQQYVGAASPARSVHSQFYSQPPTTAGATRSSSLLSSAKPRGPPPAGWAMAGVVPPAVSVPGTPKGGKQQQRQSAVGPEAEAAAEATVCAGVEALQQRVAKLRATFGEAFEAAGMAAGGNPHQQSPQQAAAAAAAARNAAAVRFAGSGNLSSLCSPGETSDEAEARVRARLPRPHGQSPAAASPSHQQQPQPSNHNRQRQQQEPVSEPSSYALSASDSLGLRITTGPATSAQKLGSGAAASPSTTHSKARRKLGMTGASVAAERPASAAAAVAAPRSSVDDTDDPSAEIGRGGCGVAGSPGRAARPGFLTPQPRKPSVHAHEQLLAAARHDAAELRRQNDALVRVLERERGRVGAANQRVAQLEAGVKEIRAEHQVAVGTLRSENAELKSVVRRLQVRGMVEGVSLLRAAVAVVSA